MSAEQNKLIARRFFESQDRRKGGPAEELCASNYVTHIAGNPPMDFEGHQQFGIVFYSAFPDLKHVINDTIAEGNKVTVRFTLQGTHNGSFMDLPPTGKPISVSAIAIMNIVDGKVAEVHGVFDQLGMMRQLGAIN